MVHVQTFRFQHSVKSEHTEIRTFCVCAKNPKCLKSELAFVWILALSEIRMFGLTFTVYGTNKLKTHHKGMETLKILKRKPTQKKYSINNFLTFNFWPIWFKI